MSIDPVTNTNDGMPLGIAVVALLAIGISLSANGTESHLADANRPIIFDKSFEITKSHEQLSKVRPEIPIITANGNTTVSNCYTYLSNYSYIGSAETSPAVTGSYSDCVFHHLLPNARGAKYFLSPEASVGNAIATRLDPTSLKDILPEWAANQYRLNPKNFDVFEVSDHAVRIGMNGKEVKIEAVASADIYASPEEELVVRVTNGKIVTYTALTSDATGSIRQAPLSMMLSLSGL